MKRYLVLALLCLLSGAGLQAQKEALRKQLRDALTAPQKVGALLALSEAFGEGEADSARYFADRAVLITSDQEMHVQHAHALQLRGQALGLLGRYAEAADDLHASSRLYASMGEFLGEASNYFSLGELYAGQNIPDSADLYFQKALGYYRDSGDDALLADAQLRYAELLMGWERLGDAKVQCDAARETADKAGDQDREAASHLLLGQVYKRWDKFPLSANQYRQALLLFERSGDLEGQARSLKGLGQTQRMLGKPAVAQDYAQRGLALAHQIGSRAEAMDLYKLLADLSADHKDFEKAYDYGRLHDMMRDSLLGETAASDLASIVNKYEQEKLRLENEKKAQEIQLGKTTIELQEERLATKNLQLLLILGGLGIMLVFGFFLLLANIQKKRANKRLAEALDNLKRTQGQLVRSEKLASLGQVTAGIAHEIRNPLNFVNNLSELSVGMVNELGEELAEIKGRPFEGADAEIVYEYFGDLKENAGKINAHGRRASRIVQDMLEHVGTGKREKRPVDFGQLADEYLQMAFHGIKSRLPDFDCAVEFQGDEKIGEVMLVSSDVGRALLNVYGNAFDALAAKAEQAGEDFQPRLEVRCSLEGGKAWLRVRDNGTGIASEHLSKVFDPFFTTKAPNEGTGLGLSLAHETIVQAHGGSMQVASDLGVYTEFALALPLR